MIPLNKKKNSKFKKVFLLMLLALVIIALIGGGIFYLIKGHSLNNSTSKSGDQRETVNFQPPTEQEKQSGDQKKSDIVNQNSNPQPPTSGKKNVQPTITYSGQYNNQVETGAFVSGIFEDGGICTLTLQKGATIKSVQVSAVKGANTVDCPVMIIQRSELEAGSWQATVSYSSTTADGKSNQTVIEVK